MAGYPSEVCQGATAERPFRILVADDDPVARRMLTTTLAPARCDIFEASDGDEAWRRFESAPTDVVITDWVMPGLDGPELARRIRASQREQYTYIIMITGVRRRTDYLSVIDSGADDLLLKPFDGRELLARVRVATRIVALQAQVHQLERLLPICAYCHRIRDEAGDWHPIETYLEGRTGAHVSHGICSTCFTAVSRREFTEE